MKNFFKNYDASHIHFSQSDGIKVRSIKCGYCENTVAPNSGFNMIYRADDAPSYHGTCLATIYECPLCGCPTIFYTETEETIPGELWGRTIKNLPDSIAKLYDECRTCYANQCYTASQMIARTLLMHIAVEQGSVEELSFAKYVNYLEERNFIPPNGKKWVDYIRKTGNVANHEIVIKEKEETKRVITFLSSLLMFIYELPNELEE